MRKLVVGLYWVLASSISMAQTITTGIISGSPFCRGETVDIPFTITDTFNADNEFIAQLSDASGDFTTPVDIGEILNSTVSGTISGAIPIDATAGSGYRIRVIGTSPATTGTINVTDLTILVVQISVTKTSYNGEDVSCNSGSDGEINITASGGTGNYTYILSGDATDSFTTSSTSHSFSGLATGSYTIDVNDANNCTAVQESITINEPSALSTTATTTDILCSGEASGSIDLTVSGGTTPYASYAWSNGTTTEDLSNVVAGTYSVTVTDANGCTTTSGDFILTEPAVALSTAATTSDILCFSEATGSIDLTVSGGTTPYASYDWSNGAATEDLINIAAGTYSVTVTDANSCTSTLTDIIVGQPTAALSTSAVVANVLCFGENTGSINLTVAGGTLPYASYAWSNGANTQDLTNLIAGTYSVTVIDANGCSTTSDDFIVSEPALALSVSTVAIKPLCFGGTDGAITVNAIGGTADYTFTLNGTTTITQTSGDYSFTGLAEGDYTIDVSDANNCTVTQLSVTVTQPAIISASASIIEPLCFGGTDGTIEVTAVGGSPDYTFTLDGSTSVTQTSGDYSFTSLPAGDYTIDVVDVNNCAVGQLNVTVTQPTNLGATTSFTEPSCSGSSDGTATVVATGGTLPYTYSWNDPATQTTETATNLPAGNYIVTVIDANSCSIILTAINITEPDLLVLSESHENIKCNSGSDGSIDITVAGGTMPYTYDWNNSASSEDLSALIAGTYILDVTDARNCKSEITIILTEPAVLSNTYSQINVSCNGLADASIDVEVAGGTSPYLYSWDNGSSTQDISGLTAGTYSLTITDANNCTDMITVNITEPSELSLTYTQTDINCSGGNNGVINITPNGGTPTYSFNWSSTDGSGLIADTEDQSGLTAGTYTVTITDINLCVASTDIIITEPALLTVAESHINLSCKDSNDGSIDVTVTGGVTPYAFDWGTAGITEDLTNLAAGVYNLTVTDAKSCTFTLPEVTITEPDLLVLSETHHNVTCFDDNGTSDDGSIDMSVTGGTGNYTFNWTSSDGAGFIATQEDQSGLSAGTYELLITDENNCTASISVIITQPDQLILSAIHTDVICFDDAGASNDGSIDLTISGGSGFYNILWSNGSTSEDLTNLAAGDYTATVTEQTGCTASLTITIQQPNQLIISETHTNVTCNDDSGSSADGAINISVTGGTTPYTYLWSNEAITEDVSGLIAGDYSVVVTDANGCKSSSTISITEPQLLQISESHTNATCSDNSNDGSIDITVTGGVGSYVYSWSNGATTEDISALAANDYTVTVTDASGCSAALTITITKPGDLIISTSSVSEVTCNDDNGSTSDGAITVDVSGGTPPYNFLWSNGATTQNITGLAGDDYTLTVTDNNGCTANHMVNVFEPAVLSITETHTNVLCFDGTTASDDGTIDLTVTGGRTPYSYSWDNGASSEDLTALAEGTYTVTVTDVNSCTASLPIIITKPTPIVVTEVHTNVTCNDDSGTSDDGSIDISVSGGMAPYTYLWGNGLSTQDISDLASGAYSLTVTDANMCTANIAVSITQPDKIIISESHANVSCFDDNGLSNDGSITVSVVGGTGAFSYLWDSGQTTATINDLGAGTYTINVSDASGCSSSLAIEITQPEQLLISESITHVTCFDDSGLSDDGSIDITITGGKAPYVYAWTSVDGQGLIASDEDQTGLSSGNYQVVITDASGCSAAHSTVINQPIQLVITETHTNISCNGGSNGLLDITVSGGTGTYTYGWNNGANTQDISALSAGTYSVTVTDENSCSSALTIVLTEPNALALTETHNDVTCYDDSGLSNDGEIQITVEGGTAPYSYLWSNGSINSSITSLSAGNYSVTVTDANSCSSSIEVTITAPEVLNITYSLANVTCNDDNGSSGDGSLDITVAGGSPGYSYNWSTSNGSGLVITDEDQAGLFAGNYSVVVTDNNSCTTELTLEITEPQLLALTETHLNVTCNDDNGTSDDGSIDITVAGGTGDYSYLWTNNATTQDLSNLAAGAYTIGVNDASGCLSSLEISIVNPNALSLTVTDPNPICQPGTVDITSTFTDNFTGTVTYWTDIAFTNAVDNPLAVTVSGAYYINKISAAGCEITRAVNVVIHPVPDLVAPTLDVLCNDQSVDLTTSFNDENGTTGTVTYWLDAATTQAIPDPTDIRTSGTYYIKKETINGCIDIEAFDIAITLQPNLIITDPSAVCQPGTIDITGSYVDANNTSGTITFWKNLAATEPVTNPSKILASGIYYIQKTTVNGCSRTAEVNVVVNILPNILVSSPEIICEGEIVNLTTVYNLEEQLPGTMTYWLNESHTNAIANPQQITSPGNYYYHFVSTAGCEDSEVLNVIVGQYPVLEVSNPEAVCEGVTVDIKSAVTDVANIDGSFTYWTNAALTIPLPDGLTTETGTYYVKKTSTYNCIASVGVDVLVNKIPILVITGATETCTPNTINLATLITDNNATTGTVTYWQDEALTTPETNHTAIAESGDFYIKKTTIFGECTDVITAAITINSTPEPPIVTLREDTLFSSAIEGNQWYNESGILAGAVSQYHVPANFGLYYVSQTLNSCESALSDGVLYDPTAVFNESAYIKFNVYPNPADYFISILLEGYEGEATITVTDMKGVTIEEKSMMVTSKEHTAVIDLSQRKNGPYIISIIAGNKLYVQKLILK